MIGISDYGVYLPWRRLSRAAIAGAHHWFSPSLNALGKGERSIAHWDEDVITMAVEAARGCIGKKNPDTFSLSSTTFPFSDRQNSGVVKEALNLPDDMRTIDTGGSWRAATGALLQAFGDDARTTLCIAAEKAKPAAMSEFEMTLGDGAAAFLLSSDNVIAEFVGAESRSTDFVDHFQASDAPTSYAWESRWIRDEGYARFCRRRSNRSPKKLE